MKFILIIPKYEYAVLLLCLHVVQKQNSIHYQIQPIDLSCVQEGHQALSNLCACFCRAGT